MKGNREVITGKITEAPLGKTKPMEESTFYNERAKFKIRRNFFTVRTIKQWNCLPSEVIGAS